MIGLSRSAVVVVLAGLAACGGPVTGPPPHNPIEGMITGIEGSTMQIETERGTFVFEIADPTVTIEHLHEHRTMELPVRITWEGEDIIRATTIEDA